MEYEHTSRVVWELYLNMEMEKAQKEGWEVVAANPYQGPSTVAQYMLILRRPKDE